MIAITYGRLAKAERGSRLNTAGHLRQDAGTIHPVENSKPYEDANSAATTNRSDAAGSQADEQKNRIQDDGAGREALSELDLPNAHTPSDCNHTRVADCLSEAAQRFVCEDLEARLSPAPDCGRITGNPEVILRKCLESRLIGNYTVRRARRLWPAGVPESSLRSTPQTSHSASSEVGATMFQKQMVLEQIGTSPGHVFES
jgi:hypothetical protein